MSVNRINVKTIPITVLDGVASTQTFETDSVTVTDPVGVGQAQFDNEDNKGQPQLFFQNSGDSFSNLIAPNPFTGRAVSAGNTIVLSNASIGSMPQPQLSSSIFQRKFNSGVAGQEGDGVESGNYLPRGVTAQIAPLDGFSPNDGLSDGTVPNVDGYRYFNPSDEQPEALAVHVSPNPPTVNVGLTAPRLNFNSGQDMYTFNVNNGNLAQNFQSSIFYDNFTRKALTNDGHQVIPGATITKSHSLV